MTFKEKDFIEIEYTGKTTEESIVFDTTDAGLAKQHDIYNEHISYGPVVVCLGEQHILKGLEEQLIGKAPGTYEITLAPEKAFGKKDPKFIQLIPTSKFLKQGIKPVPGLQINIDGIMGTVKTVSGGRTIVDFNNPLSGKEVHYTIKAIKNVEDLTAQITSLMRFSFRLKEPAITITGTKAALTFEQELPPEAQKIITDKIKSLTKISEIDFSFKKSKKQQ